MVLIVVPFAMVCAGKSHFWQTLQDSLKDPEFLQMIGVEKKFSFASVSSDDTRAQIMDDIQKKKNLTRDQAFDQSRKASNKAYHDKFVKELEDIMYLKEGDCRILYLDKNHPANSLEPVNKAINEYIPRNVLCK